MTTLAATATWHDYLTLCKPRVVALMLLTAIVGMLLASYSIPWHSLFFGTIGIGLAACSAATINQLIDRRIDAVMLRTQNRPLPKGNVSLKNATAFAAILGFSGLFILWYWVNPLTTVLTFATLIGYAVIYTVYLKRATPQNIVIGGLAGATPPLLGWTAVTGQIEPAALLLVLIIYTWTPPHFWALAVARYEEYAKAKIPMLPVTHGIRYTNLSSLLYTLLMIVSTLLPFVIDMSGWLYLAGSSLLNVIFLYFVIRLYLTQDRIIAMKTFRFSINYLMLLFVLLLLDHYI